MKSRARVGATLSALAATATAALPISATAQAAPTATQAPTRTTLSANPADIPFGAVAKLKAVVKPVIGSGQPTGTVTFSQGTTVLGTVALALVGSVETAKLSVPGLAIGDYQFTAHYNGATNFAASTSLPLTVTVGPADSVTTLSFSSGSMIVLHQSAKLKATVKAKVAETGSPSGGTVTFMEGATVLGSGPVPVTLVGSLWTAKLTVAGLPVGDHLITATFNGSADLAVSTSAEKTLTVNKGDTTVAITSSIDGTGNYLFTAQVKRVLPATGTPSGIVTFFIDGLAAQPYALGASGQATTAQAVTLDPGPHTVKVTYGGDAAFNASENTLTFTI
ncbi:MAG: Ig-like domain-containing protein [Actinomycetes bacterium]